MLRHMAPVYAATRRLTGAAGLLLGGGLGAVEILVGALEEVGRGVVRRELGYAGRDLERPDLRDRLDADGALDPGREVVGVAPGRLGQDHRELVAADAAADVGRADAAAHARRHLGEDGVAGEAADAAVEPLEAAGV